MSRNLNERHDTDTLRGLIDHYQSMKDQAKDKYQKDLCEKEIARLRMKLTILGESS